jgi:proteasome accessory factor B
VAAGGPGRPASRALLKLQASGAETSDLSIAGMDPRLDTSEAAFLPLMAATRERRAVRFPYRRSGGSGEPEQRTVEPWGLVAWRGRWYLVGQDRARDARRVFRLSRIAGDVRPVGPRGRSRCPRASTCARTCSGSSAASSSRGRRSSASAPERASSCAAGADVTPLDDGWDELRRPYADVELLADDVAGLGPGRRGRRAAPGARGRRSAGCVPWSAASDAADTTS